MIQMRLTIDEIQMASNACLIAAAAQDDDEMSTKLVELSKLLDQIAVHTSKDFETRYRNQNA